MGRYQFTHALIQETLAQEVSSTRRARLHAEIAQVLEELYGDSAEAHAAELAHHFSEAELVLGIEKLVRYSVLAGNRALASHAHEDALAHFERGVLARDISRTGMELASDEESATLLIGLARAQSATGDGFQLVEAFATLRRAFEYYTEAGNVELAVAAAEIRIASPAAQIPGIAQLMAHALTLVPADSHEAGRLLSQYGGVLGVSEGDYEGAQQVLEKAISIAKRDEDVPLEVQTLIYAADVNGTHLHWHESIDQGRLAIELATNDENPYSAIMSRYWTAMGLLHIGDIDAARPHALAIANLADRRSAPLQLASNGFSVPGLLVVS